MTSPTFTSFEDDFGLPTPVLRSSSSEPSNHASTGPLLSASATIPNTYGTLATSSARPVLLQRALSTASATTDTFEPRTTPQVARAFVIRQNANRPSLGRTATAPAKPMRPGLIYRLSSSIAQTLELVPSATTYTATSHPKRPSYWTDHAYRGTLLRTWDQIRERAASTGAEIPSSVVGQLDAVKTAMIERFPELAVGDVALGKEWIVWVLGRALRQPFCTEGGMGRWEVLSAVGRGRGGGSWGVW